uniref:Uncharacterized protein n=1 Tax=Pseudomonas phage RVTF4 TaxID=3236931 RepID=A0AB39CCH7_9VIRU
MCSSNDALRKLIDEAIGGSIADLTFTGWKDDSEGDDPYRGRAGGEQNIFITTNGVNAGGIAISPGSNINNGGFRFGNEREGTPLTIETMRSILVTALAVSPTPRGQALAGAFAKVVESLATNCFVPVRYDMNIFGARDPYVSIELSNGMQTIAMATAEKPFDGDLAGFTLDIPNRYHLGTRIAEILTGASGSYFGYSPTGLQIEIDGKWKRVMGLTAHTVREEEREELKNDPIAGLPDLAAIFGDSEKGKLNLKLATAVIAQLEKVHTSVLLRRVDLTQYSREGKGTVRLDLVKSDFSMTFSLDFERE